MSGAYQGVRVLRFTMYALYVYTCTRNCVLLPPIANCQTRAGTGMILLLKQKERQQWNGVKGNKQLE